MGILPHNRPFVRLFVLLALAVLLLAACSPDPTAQLISPDMDFTVGEAIVEAKPTPTPEILDITILTVEEVFAGLPDTVVAAIQGGDPQRGLQISQLNGCIGCHSLEKGVRLVGPTWYGIANLSIKRVPGESPAYYLYDSIVNTNDFVVPDYPIGVMPQNYGDLLSEQDLGHLVAYLLTFTGQ